MKKDSALYKPSSPYISTGYTPLLPGMKRRREIPIGSQPKQKTASAPKQKTASAPKQKTASVPKQMTVRSQPKLRSQFARKLAPRYTSSPGRMPYSRIRSQKRASQIGPFG